MAGILRPDGVGVPATVAAVTRDAPVDRGLVVHRQEDYFLDMGQLVAVIGGELEKGKEETP